MIELLSVCLRLAAVWTADLFMRGSRLVIFDNTFGFDQVVFRGTIERVEERSTLTGDLLLYAVVRTSYPSPNQDRRAVPLIHMQRCPVRKCWVYRQ